MSASGNIIITSSSSKLCDTLRPASRNALTEGIMTGKDPRHLVLKQALSLRFKGK